MSNPRSKENVLEAEVKEQLKKLQEKGSAPYLELKAHIKTLQNSFIETWSKSSDRPLVEKFFRDKDYDPNLELIIEKFPKYKSQEEITEDFNFIFGCWNGIKNVKNDSFHRAYQITLAIMEAHFLDAFAQQLAIPPKIPNEELKEEAVNIEETATSIVDSFQKSLEKEINEQAAEFKKTISQEASILEGRIKDFNAKCKVIDEATLQEEVKSSEEKLFQLLRQENVYLADLAQLEELQKLRNDLSNARDEKVISQVAQIEQHIAKSRGAVKSLQPQIDFSTFSSFQAKEKIITQLENKRKAILRECYNDAKHKRLRKKLKENLDQVAKDLAKYSKDHQGFFVSSKEEANITCQNLSTNQRLLEHSPLFEVDKEKSTQLGQNLIETISKIEKRKNKLDKLKNVVTARVAEKISQSGQVKMAEDIFESLRKELIFTSNVSEIAPLPTKNIINKRKALDRAWAELTCTPDTIVLMEKASTESLDPRIRLRLTALMEKYKESQAKIQIEESQVVVIQPEPVGDLLKNEESNPLLPLFPSELSLEVEPQEKQSLKVEKPLKKPGILEIIYNALKTFYSVIKEFFSKLISCFSCGRSDEKNLDEDSPPPPIVDNEKGESRILPSSTATLPFPIGTHVKQSDQITTDNLNHVIISNPSLPLSPKPPR